MMSVLRRFETIFTVLTVVYYTSILSRPLGLGLNEDDPTFSTVGVDDSSSPILKLIQITILVVLFLLVGLRWKRVLIAAIQVPLCWALPALAILSAQWSEVPDFTFRKGLILMMATLMGVYWSIRYPLATLLRLLGWGLGLTVILCFVFTLVFPNFGIEHGEHTGAWRGLFTQKNGLARIMVLSVVTGLWLVLERERQRFWWSGKLFLSVILLILSTSKTGLVIMVASVGCIPLLRALRGRLPQVILGLMLAILSMSCVVLVLIENAELILTALGRDITLTGRTGIWDVMLTKIANHPWLGYGYQSFWLGMDGESADVWYATFFMAPNGHNGYLDLALDLGLIGLGIFVISCGFAVVRSTTWLRQHPHSMVSVFPLLYLTYLLLYNITESSLILEPNNLFWLLYVYVATSIQTQAVDLKTPSDLTVHSNLREAHHA